MNLYLYLDIYYLFIDLFIYFFCENMLFFKLIYLYNVDMRKNTVAIYIASGLWTVGPHPVSLAAQPLARLRIQDLTPELTCEAPLLNYITFQN